MNIRNIRSHLATMKAITVTNHKEISDSWKIFQTPLPTLSQGQVLVQMHCASINPLDLWMSRGYGGKLFANQGIIPPYVLGRDGSGTIVDLAHGVWDWKKGDKVIICPSVFTSQGGTFAEYCVASQFEIAKKPENITF